MLLEVARNDYRRVYGNVSLLWKQVFLVEARGAARARVDRKNLMEIPVESLRAAVVREIHSTILRYFREIMNRMEVARALGNESPGATCVLATGHFKKWDAARITRAEVSVVVRVDKRGPNYLAESGNIKANAISA